MATLWLATQTHPFIAVTARISSEPASNDFNVHRLPFPILIHVETGGTYYVVLKSPRHTVTLRICGVALVPGGVSLTVTVTGLLELKTVLPCLESLVRAEFDDDRLARSELLGRVESVEFTNAIIAIDGERAGASRRAIAEVMFGSRSVDADWAEPGGRLRSIVKRSVLRGRRMVAGGYRQLLSIGGAFGVIT